MRSNGNARMERGGVVRGYGKGARSFVKKKRLVGWEWGPQSLLKSKEVLILFFIFERLWVAAFHSSV